jgi:glycosyltransferase involved in cell wall biosynthesis
MNEYTDINELNGKKTEYIPKFTIIIAVTHSIDCLRECLKSLERLDYPKKLFHVVLVDCHVLPGLKGFFEVNVRDYRCRITALSLPEQHGKHEAWLHEARLNEARNYAMDKVPGQYFVFTEDDCMFEPDWLTKFDRALSDDLGAAGGPDILPEGMGWLPTALECILTSFLGTAGAKRGDGVKNAWYYPRKENTVIPAKVIKRIGKFPENMIFGAEMEMAKRIRDAGLQIKYIPDNPVWHRRVTTFRNLIRRNIYHAAEKVRLLRRQRAFIRSPHFIVFLAAATGLSLGLFAIINPLARSLFLAMTGLYLATVLFISVSSFRRTRSVSVGLGILLLLPSHHFSIMAGVMKGAISKVTE